MTVRGIARPEGGGSVQLFPLDSFLVYDYYKEDGKGYCGDGINNLGFMNAA